MTAIDQLRYDGKRAVVSGGASGMGRAVAEILRDLGAEIHVLDVNPVDFDVHQSVTMDLRDVEQIDAALEQVGAPIDALISCAGVSGPPFSPVDVMLINFVGARHLIESAAASMMPEGSAVAMISSIGGLGWPENLAQVMELLATPDYEGAKKWCEANVAGEAENAEIYAMVNYALSKQAIDVYVQYRAVPFMHRRIRINATGPGPTMTPLMDATPIWGSFEDEEFKVKMGGVAGATPEQQAFPLVFLCSDAASFVSGQVLNVDAGYSAGGVMGAFGTYVVRSLVDPA